ncbi:MAG: hypothetical protein JKY37_24490 [Nannocystaceae bacterium]|nr:hypothetical protein [Nannocystaceae bacterium]
MMYLSFIGLLVVVGGWVAYLATVPKGNVPARPVAHVVAMLLGAVFSVVGLALAVRDGPWSTSAALAVPTLMMSGLFFYLLTQRKTPLGEIRIKLGDTLPAFATPDSEGHVFETATLAGQRVLIKFFRGRW